MIWALRKLQPHDRFGGLTQEDRHGKQPTAREHALQ